MRGEHVISTVVGWVSQGSSPHARGPRGVEGHEVPEVGIIPACAGSTPTIRSDCMS